MSSIDLAAWQAQGVNLVFLAREKNEGDLARYLIALANGGGGRIVIGQADLDKPGRLTDPTAVRDLVMTVALACDPPLIVPAPVIGTVRDHPVVVIEIPPDLPHVYNFEGRYLIWENDQPAPLSGQALRRLIFARGETGFENMVVPGATLRAINWDAVAGYIQTVEALSTLTPEAALLKRGCLKEIEGKLQPTYAGILLFGRDPQRWLPDSGVTVARYSGLQMSDAFIRADIQGTLPQQARHIEAFILENIGLEVQINALQRSENYLYPIPAVREVIVNALAHRDYSIKGDSSRFLLFANRLECYNPGRLPGHITVANIQEERFSRNATIVQVMFDFGFIERLGYGIKRIIRSLVEQGLPEPEMTETAAGFKVVLYNQAALTQAQNPLVLRQWMEMGLNERQIAALGFLADNNRITNAEYQNLCPTVSPETLRRDLADLVARNILLRIGEKRATFYILK